MNSFFHFIVMIGKMIGFIISDDITLIQEYFLKRAVTMDLVFYFWMTIGTSLLMKSIMNSG